MSGQYRYVLGFMFAEGLSRVALIRKRNPPWQRGKLNGIGGKIEAGESHWAAMVREFAEEAGCSTTREQWSHFAEMSGEENKAGALGSGQSLFQVDCFATVGPLSNLVTMEREAIEIFDTNDITPLRRDVVESVPFLVGLAVANLRDNCPTFTVARY